MQNEFLLLPEAVALLQVAGMQGFSHEVHAADQVLFGGVLLKQEYSMIAAARKHAE